MDPACLGLSPDPHLALKKEASAKRDRRLVARRHVVAGFAGVERFGRGVWRLGGGVFAPAALDAKVAADRRPSADRLSV